MNVSHGQLFYEAALRRAAKYPFQRFLVENILERWW